MTDEPRPADAPEVDPAPASAGAPPPAEEASGDNAPDAPDAPSAPATLQGAGLRAGLGVALFALLALAGGLWAGRWLAGRDAAAPSAAFVAPGAPAAEASALPVYLKTARPMDPAYEVGELPAFAGVLDQAPPQLGAPAPDFELARLGQETPARLSDFAGRPVVLNFWATWCVPCLEEMPYLQQVQDELADEGLVVLAVDVEEEPRLAANFMRSMGLRLPVLFDLGGDVADHYRIVSYPTTYLVDPEGRLAAVKRGAYDSEQELRGALARILPAAAP